MTFGRWWSFISISTRRNSTSCPSVNPAICTGAFGAPSAALASVFVDNDLVFLLVIVGDAVASDAIGDVGSGVSGRAAPDGPSSTSPGSETVMLLSVRSISPSWSRGRSVSSIC